MHRATAGTYLGQMWAACDPKAAVLYRRGLGQVHGEFTHASRRETPQMAETSLHTVRARQDYMLQTPAAPLPHPWQP